MERGKAEKAKTLKSFNNLRKINDFGLLGPSWEASWGVLEASWAVWGPSWASWSDLSSALSPFQSSGRPPEAALGRFWPLVGERSVPEADATIPESAQERPRAPGNLGVWAPKKLQFWTSRGCMSLGALHFVLKARWRILEHLVFIASLSPPARARAQAGSPSRVSARRGG